MTPCYGSAARTNDWVFTRPFARWAVVARDSAGSSLGRGHEVLDTLEVARLLVRWLHPGRYVVDEVRTHRLFPYNSTPRLWGFSIHHPAGQVEDVPYPPDCLLGEKELRIIVKPGADSFLYQVIRDGDLENRILMASLALCPGKRTRDHPRHA
jgi:hypothetical protein